MLGDEPNGESRQEHAKALGETVREYVRKGNVTRILIKRGSDVLVNLPLNAGIVGGIIGAVAAPWALITAAIATAGFDCRVEIIKDDGEHVDLGFEKFGRAVRDAGSSVVNEVRGAVDSIRSAGKQTEDPAVDEEIPFEDANKDE